MDKSKIKILVVEDESIIGIFIKKNLENLGYNVCALVSTGEESIKQAELLKPDLILMDIVLAGKMSGIDASKIIKNEFNIPIIYITGNADVATIKEARESRPYGYIIKPIDIQSLFSTIDTSLNLYNMEMELKDKNEYLERSNEEFQTTLEELEESNQELIDIRNELYEYNIKLSNSEKIYHSLFNNMINGFALHEIICDDDGKPFDYKFLEINPAFEKITGLKKDIVGKTARDIFPNIEYYWIETYGKVALNGEIIEFENYSQDLDKYFKVTAYPQENNNFSTIFEDITERKKSDEILNEYKKIIENFQDLVAVIDKDYNYVYVNKCYATTYNLDINKIIGKHISIITGVEKFEKLIKKNIEKCFKGECLQNEDIIDFPNIGKRNTLITNFPIEENNSINKIVTIIKDITNQKQTEEKLLLSLNEKEILLKEIHHRVKNNFQIIISLLGLQSRNINDEKFLEYFNDSINRIRSMALVHENLYQSKDLAKIDYVYYIKTLSNELYNMFNGYEKGIQLHFNLESTFLTIDKAIPCGLIINELLTNAFKYAFPNKWKGDPEINIYLKNINENDLELIVQDNGIGINEAIEIKKTNTLGLKLVTSLTEQLNGSFEIVDNDIGTKFLIKFVNE